ncbi:MAG TPA: polymer-forming cytoskeletal protein, partial [Azospirillaceae bacterium]|nr:polymer-forming cytoskeletal protein [Azospirillaceae bacterium]
AQRRLIVGRDISLAGEIASCDVLVVEGTVEAKLRDGHSVEITETGLFKGSVEIDDADIGGRFEGDLVVRNRLRVRSGGRIIGSIVYGELEVESGGRLEGSIKLYDPQPKTEVAAAPAPAPVVDAAPAPVQAPVVEQSSGDVQPAQVYVPPTQTFNG